MAELKNKKASPLKSKLKCSLPNNYEFIALKHRRTSEKMDCLFRKMLEHLAEFEIYNITISLRLTRDCRALQQ